MEVRILIIFGQNHLFSNWPSSPALGTCVWSLSAAGPTKSCWESSPRPWTSCPSSRGTNRPRAAFLLNPKPPIPYTYFIFQLKGHFASSLQGMPFLLAIVSFSPKVKKLVLKWRSNSLNWGGEEVTFGRQVISSVRPSLRWYKFYRNPARLSFSSSSALNWLRFVSKMTA